MIVPKSKFANFAFEPVLLKKTSILEKLKFFLKSTHNDEQIKN